MFIKTSPPSQDDWRALSPYVAWNPPSMGRVTPFTMADRSLSRNTMQFTTSHTSANLIYITGDSMHQQVSEKGRTKSSSVVEPEPLKKGRLQLQVGPVLKEMK